MNRLANRLLSSRTSTIFGAIIWLLLLAIPLPTDAQLEPIARLLLLAVLVITPLALPLAAPPERAHYAILAQRAAIVAQPFAAALAIVAFYQPAGRAAALLAAAWLLPTGLAALTGMLRLLSRRNGRADELSVDAGLIYLPVGAVWLLFNRLGLNPLAFGDTIVLLTAVHFHYAGFAAPILSGLLGRQIANARPAAWPLFRLVAAGVIAGIALVAAGITLARYTPVVEVGAALLFAISLLGLAALTLGVGLPIMTSHLARALLAISSAARYNDAVCRRLRARAVSRHRHRQHPAHGAGPRLAQRDRLRAVWAAGADDRTTQNVTSGDSRHSAHVTRHTICNLQFVKEAIR